MVEEPDVEVAVKVSVLLVNVQVRPVLGEVWIERFIVPVKPLTWATLTLVAVDNPA